MRRDILTIILIFTIIIFAIYSDQMIVGIAVLILYILGFLFAKIFSKDDDCINVYTLFFIIYSIELLLTQYLFIDSTEGGYFNHSDAAGSFYQTSVMNFDYISWNNLVENTVFNSFFSEYPLFSLWINAWKLVGDDIGVTLENMRMFLRLQDLIFASGIILIVAKYFKEIGFSYEKVTKYCLAFGFCSYLFLTSVVFTRDLHIAFFYTLAGYYCISPFQHKFIYAKFMVITLVCFGLRSENGMFSCIFPVYYYFRDTPLSIKLLAGGIIVLLVVSSLGFIDSFIEAREGFGEHTLEFSQGGLYSIFNSLPFPLNFIFNAIYSLMLPFPITQYIANPHISWVGIPSIAIPFLNLLMLSIIFQYLRFYNNDYKTLYFFLVTIMYIIMSCNIEPNVRRTFAIIPSLYMLFAYAKQFVPDEIYKSYVRNIICFLSILNIPAILYLIQKGKL